jgi:hypothetical protein
MGLPFAPVHGNIREQGLLSLRRTLFSLVATNRCKTQIAVPWMRRWNSSFSCFKKTRLLPRQQHNIIMGENGPIRMLVGAHDDFVRVQAAFFKTVL